MPEPRPLLTSIDRNPVPRGTTNHPDKAFQKFASLQTDSGLQLDLEIALSGDQRRSSPCGLFSRAEDALKRPGDVIEGILPALPRALYRTLVRRVRKLKGLV